MDHRPDEVSLKQRWKRLVEEPKADKREAWFYPHEGGDRTISKGESKGLTGHHKELASIEFGIAQRDSTDPKFKANATEDCQEFRVWAGIMGKKESHYVPTQRTCDPV